MSKFETNEKNKNEDLTPEEIIDLQLEYPPGTTIELINMENDPDPIPIGTIGRVIFIDGAGVIHIKWDNERTFGIIPKVDKFKKIS